MGNKVIKTLSPAYSILSEGRIYFLVFDSRFSFCFFQFVHIHNVVLTLFNVVEIGVEKCSIVSTLPNEVQIDVEIDNVE